ncbi:apolipoprotein N-acyltransferase [Moraxella sp. RCAD0137]|uniref:apolipoprotein N-acyltransferase n=1 Tax=Moraxella sp. RCAD0137 TaxID=1775913 RepID=UPI000C9ED7AF|nr:apolipoprotein N-acyltransferase [Moraxella sp. RCAD0137]PNP98675.1 apolipoprotein N-acyltransferase [Moraxella sp. RCAD0137]
MTKAATSFRAKATTHRTLPLGIACLLALFAGAIFSLALAPYYLFPIAIISPMVLYVLLLGAKNPRQAFWLGESYGFGVWAVGAFWLYHSIHNYGGVPAWAAVMLIGVMALIMGLFHAVMAWVFARFTARQPLAFAGLWVVQEWAKTWLLTGFPWLFVGYAFTDVSWLNGIAAVTGVFGLSFLAVLLAAALVELLRRKAGYFAIAMSLWMVTLSISLIDFAWTKPTGQTTSVSLIQGNIPQDLKWQEGAGIQTLGIYAGLSQSEWGRDIVIWPEAAIPMFQDEAQAQIDAIAKQAAQAGSAWMTGILYRDSQDGATQLYNSVLLTDQATSGIYHKQQLVPFGEYIPMGGLLDVLPGLEGMQGLASLSRGDAHQAPLSAKDQRVGVAICYEVAYPDTTRRNAIGTDFLLTVSNDAWFGTSAGPMQHLQMVQMRSLETGRYFVRATNNGVTAIINDKGQVISSLPQFERAVLRGDVPSMTGKTPFMIFGHYPVLIISILLILLSILANRMNNTSAKKEKYYTAKGVADR